MRLSQEGGLSTEGREVRGRVHGCVHTGSCTDVCERMGCSCVHTRTYVGYQELVCTGPGTVREGVRSTYVCQVCKRLPVCVEGERVGTCGSGIEGRGRTRVSGSIKCGTCGEVCMSKGRHAGEWVCIRK